MSTQGTSSASAAVEGAKTNGASPNGNGTPTSGVPTNGSAPVNSQGGVESPMSGTLPALAQSNGIANSQTPPAQPKPETEEDHLETLEWLESLDYVLKHGGPERARQLLNQLQIHAQMQGVTMPFSANTPYINTIPPEAEPKYPGNRDIERRIKSAVRWNAMAMVLRANPVAEGGVGGHISTFASSATLYEVAQNHFFQGKNAPDGGDQVYFQGHASPGMYARAFLEGRLTEDHLKNFRRELQPHPGLSSYPHPWLMPEFWEFPTVSMGLGPITSIYQARFNRYLENRGLKQTANQRVWAFLGDGECDEPETLGSITLAAREKLDNLTWVINCNLQRLDGPVRGNGKIIQELEALFRGAGWNVIKVVWSSQWDRLLEADTTGALVQRMGEVVDGQYQKYTVESGQYVRDHFFGKNEATKRIGDMLSDEEVRTIRRGGHDPEKVYAAYKAATDHKGAPTVVLAKTVKGYGIAGEGLLGAHNNKKVESTSIREFRDRFGIPISDEDLPEIPFYSFPPESKEAAYLKQHREALGGYVPTRKVQTDALPAPADATFAEFYKGMGDRTNSTTQSFVTLITRLLRDKGIGKNIVPIVPDEARTFGMEGLFGTVGIYSSVGQLYDPVDNANVLYYKESQKGQLLEEGINEAGAISSWVAAATSYATHGVPMIPFYIYYSMFGQQRVGDLMWLAGDVRAKGFLLGATAGRTTLNGEGLQHQDGHTHLMGYVIPNMMCYDPAYAFELAVIVQEGIRRMYEVGETLFYYITLMNEQYHMPAMPEGDNIKQGILDGLYLFKRATKPEAKLRATLLGSGTILNEVLKAQTILSEQFGVEADVWSATSYKCLCSEALECERYNLLNPTAEQKVPYVTRCLQDGPNVVVASSDYMKTLPNSIAKYIPGRLMGLGTEGYGRSESREALRDFFEVDAKHVAFAALVGLMRDGKVTPEFVEKAATTLSIDPHKKNPMIS